MQSMLALSMMLAGQPLPAPFVRRRPEPPRTLEDFEHSAEPEPLQRLADAIRTPPTAPPVPTYAPRGVTGVPREPKIERAKRRPTAERLERRRVRKQRRNR